jgi:hypothetical protein
MFGDLEQRLKGWFESHLEKERSSSGTRASGQIIQQVTDPGFLRDKLKSIQTSAAGTGQLSEAQYSKAFEELDQASQAPPGAPFMARTPTNGIAQSVLSTCIEGRADSLLDAAPGGLEKVAHAVLRTLDIFREFGPCDPMWIETKIAEGIAMIDHKPPFPAEPAPAVPLAENARVLVVGDWGTGLPGAIAVGRRMREKIDEARGREQHVIHLGDVYYSGWREEYEDRFLPYWPVDAGESEVLSWALNGNHDMYSGGHGYFGFLLRDPRFRGHWLPTPNEHRSSSYFSIENDHWQLLGLDSAYADHDLAGDQARWIAEQLGSPGRRTMLMTHHQPFSAYEPVGQLMTDQVKSAVGEGKLDAWIWGHEHRCMVYQPDPAPYLSFGSCVGHGGVPRILPDPAPGAPQIKWALETPDESEGNQWGRFGFAVLDFDGAAVRIQYVDETGTVNHEERL